MIVYRNIIESFSSWTVMCNRISVVVDFLTRENIIIFKYFENARDGVVTASTTRGILSSLVKLVLIKCMFIHFE